MHFTKIFVLKESMCLLQIIFFDTFEFTWKEGNKKQTLQISTRIMIPSLFKLTRTYAEHPSSPKYG